MGHKGSGLPPPRSGCAERLPCLLLCLLLVPPTVVLSQVGPSCIMGEDCVVGDKTSVKRSVIGSNCR